MVFGEFFKVEQHWSFKGQTPGADGICRGVRSLAFCKPVLIARLKFFLHCFITYSILIVLKCIMVKELISENNRFWLFLENLL